MTNYVVQGWTEKGTPWVDATPVYQSFELALEHIRKIRSQGLLSRARIVDSAGSITDWPEIQERLAGGSDAGHSGGN
jgi:hypothetical protein